MKWFWVVGILAMLAASAIAGGQTKRKDPRSDLIWDSAHNRFVDQLDYWWDDGDFPRCVQLLRIMAELTPDDYEIATDLGWMLENVEQMDAALAVYVKFRKDNPGDGDAPFPEANFYYKQRLFAKVPPLLEQTLVLKPHPNSWRILAHSYEKMGMLSDSRRVWTTYLRQYPNDEPAKNNLRRVEGKLGKAGR